METDLYPPDETKSNQDSFRKSPCATNFQSNPKFLTSILNLHNKKIKRNKLRYKLSHGRTEAKFSKPTKPKLYNPNHKHVPDRHLCLPQLTMKPRSKLEAKMSDQDHIII